MMIKKAARTLGPIGLAALLLAVPGCDKIGNPLDVIGGNIPAPDEFQVVNHKPLMMPPSADLPEPRPGAASPLDPDPYRDARQALLGSGGSTVVSTTTPGAGEQVLLASANAATASSEIRVQIERDKIEEKTNKPYEPPSLVELLGGKSKNAPDESTLLDPAAESQRLQSEGKITPVDPNATAAVAEEDLPKPVQPGYPAGRPQNRITVEGTAPKY